MIFPEEDPPMSEKKRVEGPATPESMLLGALVGGMDAMADAVEGGGQESLVASDQIPVKRQGVTDAELVALGFVLGEVGPDRLFQDATLPPGWRKVATEHNLWTRIVDGDGLERFSVFFKAAPWDREAFMRPC
jgi:hypothetical protein